MIDLRRLSLPAALALFLAGCSTDSPDPTEGLAPESGSPGAPGLKRAGTVVPGTKVREILAEAKRAAESGNHGTAASLCEEVLKVEPANRQALYMLAIVSQEQAVDLERPKSSAPFLRAASAMRRLRSEYPQLIRDETALLQNTLFNEARTYAALGQPEKAVDSLLEAVDAGFQNLKALRTEPELEPIRKLPRFQVLLTKMEAETRVLAGQVAKEHLVAKPFPFAFKLPGTDGTVVSSSDFRGKVVIADFWGTWCPPCRAEIPHLVELSRKYKEKGLEVVGLTYERVPDKDVKATIEEFVKRSGVTYPCLIGDEATMEQVPKLVGFPTTLFLDRTGMVRARLDGFDPEDHARIFAIEQIVTSLLAESPKPRIEGAPESGGVR